MEPGQRRKISTNNFQVTLAFASLVVQFSKLAFFRYTQALQLKVCQSQFSPITSTNFRNTAKTRRTYVGLEIKPNSKLKYVDFYSKL